MDLGREEGDAQAEAGEGVAMGPSDALDETVQAEASEVIGHRATRVGGEVAAQEGGDVRAQVAIAEAGREMSEAAERLEQCHHARVAEAEGRDALGALLTWGLQLSEHVLVQ